MDGKLPAECIDAWNAMLRDDAETKAGRSTSERLRMFFALFELNRFVPEHPTYTRWREKEKQVVRERWKRITDRLRQDRGPLAG